MKRANTKTKPPRVGVVKGGDSDWKVMQHAVAVVKNFGVPHEARVVSVQRTPDRACK
ncbi:MAG: AIR carboxylase family protein [Gammaproteobacteria bacterium]